MKKIFVVTLLVLSAFLYDDQYTKFERNIDKSVEKGLAFLALKQNDDGSWTCKIGQKAGESYYGKDGKHVGVTSLATIAFMMNGHFTERGKYYKIVKKAIDFIQTCVTEDGYVTFDGSRMYSHAFATLCLSFAYGMTKDDTIRQKLKKAVDLISRVQNKEGGWRYSPSPTDSDLSITVSTLQALRAAKTAGISVSIDVINSAQTYVKQCSTLYGFSYQNYKTNEKGDHRVTYPLTACGVVSMYSVGNYKSKEIDNGLRRLKNIDELRWGKYHYLYGHYYASQAMYMAGPSYWNSYYKTVASEILAKQLDDGSWKDDVGPTYATAMACIILQMPNETFPIFQK